MEDLLKQCAEFNVIDKFGQVFSEGYYIDSSTKKITPGGDFAMIVNHPWIHFHGAQLSCVPEQMLFRFCRFVPTRCLDCWKVVVVPRTVDELIRCYRLMEELKLESKCGIEERPHVPRNYGCYFYERSKDDGLARREDIKKIFRVGISNTIPVFLKRFCTEFELELCPGASHEYQQSPDAKKWEELFYECFDTDKMRPKDPNQPKFLKDHIISRWLFWARDRGDPTALKYNEGVEFYTPSKTYN